MDDAPEFSPPNRLHEMAPADRPLERIERHGAAALSDTELLALLLRSGTRGQDVMTLATRLLAAAGSLPALVAWRESEFRRLKGIGRVKACQLVAAMEIARRAASLPSAVAPPLHNAANVATFFQPIVLGLDVEKFWVLCLNRKHRLLKRVEVSSGTATSALAHPREVFRIAVCEGATGVVCVHNHPSGDPSPSSADLQITRQLRESARIIDIDFLDHVIIGRTNADPTGRGYFSFREGHLL
ncbi:MAG: DNA repair protein RadC [Verrucomicrobia bacterium]|nr:DNA repair protein RadC [Verrucomicrobiota bacterium]